MQNTWNKIWNQLSTDQWLDLLNEYRPENGWKLRGSRIIGRCVYHQEDTPSFHIVPSKGFAYCFGASCRTYETNPVYLLSKVLKQKAYHVLRELKSRYNIKFSTEDAEQLQKEEQQQIIKNLIYKVCTSALHDSLNSPAAFAKNTIEWLRTRKIPFEVIHSCPIGILPPRDKLYEYLRIFGNEKRYEDVYLYLEKQYSNTPGVLRCEGWLCFFYFNTPTTLSRIKLREPSNKHNFVFVEDTSVDNGVFGLNMFPETRVEFEERFVYIVEGEFDALTLIAQQLLQGRNDIFVVASGGAMVDNLDVLVERFGFKGIRLVADNDEAGRWRTLDWLRTNKSPMQVFCWPAGVRAKDPDEFLRDNPENLDVFIAAENFTSPLNWVQQQLANELPKKQSPQEKMNTIIQWGQGLNNPLERDAFIQFVQQQFNISNSVVSQILAQSSGESDFVIKLETLLRNHLEFIAADVGGNGNVNIVVWSKRRKQLFNLIRGRGLHAALELETGPIDAFVEQKIGLPDFIKYTTKKNVVIERSLLAKQQMLMGYIETALSKIAEELPSIQRYEIVGQGIHYLPDENENYEIYLVNGSQFYRGSIDNDSVQYSVLDAPTAHRKYLFKSSNIPWSKHINSIDDLKIDESLDIQKTFRRLYEFINKSWQFEDNYDTLFLTAYIFYIPIAALFKHMIFVDITGPTHSGKSSFLWLLHGGADPRYRICESTALLENYTAAGVRQFMANNRFCLLLDEFEDRDAGAQTNQKAWAVREILEMIRSASSGAMFVRGTTHGEPLVGKINFPLIVGGIFTMQQPQDLNRFIHVMTKEKRDLISPLIALQERFSLQELEYIRRVLTLGLLQRAHEICALHEETVKEFKGHAAKLGVLDRQLKNFLPVTTILRYVGEDYKTFLEEYSQCKMRRLKLIGGTDQLYERVWDAIFNTPLPIHHFSAGTSQGMMTILNMLADRTHTEMLHSLGIGVYYIEKYRWAVVVWSQIASTILRYNQEFKRVANLLRLKSEADKHPNVISPDKISTVLFKEEIEPLLKNSLRIQQNNYSIFNLSQYNLRGEESTEETKIFGIEGGNVIENV